MKIFVIDTETTGLMGAPYDSVLEVGIASVDLADGRISREYNAIIEFNEEKMARYISHFGNPWIFERKHMLKREVYNGTPESVVIREVKDIVGGHLITSYNTAFDLNKFLYKRPWNLKEWTRCPFDLADLATKYVKECIDKPRPYESGIEGKISRQMLANPTSRIHMIDAYHCLIGKTPEQTHRAIDDAMMEAEILARILCKEPE